MKKYVFETAAIAIVFAILSIAAAAQTINLQLQNTYTLGGTMGTPRFAIGDLNNDGRPDIVTSVGLVNTPVSIFLNNGAGGLSAPTTVGANLNATAVAIGDFNNDGFADLAIGSVTTTFGINIRLGNGTGTFASGTDTAVADGVTDLLTADFNGDGNLDLAMTRNNGYPTPPTNSVHVMFGNGAGGFGAPQSSPAIGSQPVDLELGDFNADGRPDIAALAFATTNTLSILLNNGTGGFSVAPTTSWPNPTSAGKMVAADFNRDCATDLAVVRSDSIAIMTGNNAGGFTLTSIPSNPPASVAAGDFNLDRKIDLAIGRLNTVGDTGFTIMPGDGAGGFGAAFSINSPDITDNLAVLDINLDGKTDIALSRRSNGFVLYDGNSSRIIRTDNDFDADGRADLGIFRPSLGNWYVLRSTQGFYQAHWGVSSDFPVTADYDGDYKSDIAVWRETGNGDPNRSYFFILRSSDNTLQQEQFGRTGDVPSVTGDWNGDGRADVAVYRSGATPGAQSFVFYRPSGGGADFNAIFWGQMGDQPVRGDFDGDGRLDAAVFRPSNEIWYVLRSSNGQPMFQNWGLASDHRVAADYDGDGRTDFAVFRPSNGFWYILGSSAGPMYRPWGNSTDTPVPGDYNADGKADVAVYRPSDQNWHVPPCAVYNGINIKFGTQGDIPVPTVP